MTPKLTVFPVCKTSSVIDKLRFQKIFLFALLHPDNLNNLLKNCLERYVNLFLKIYMHLLLHLVAISLVCNSSMPLLSLFCYTLTGSSSLVNESLRNRELFPHLPHFCIDPILTF
jgi:hypothetical protein